MCVKSPSVRSRSGPRASLVGDIVKTMNLPRRPGRRQRIRVRRRSARATDRSALFASTQGMVVTCLYLLGLLERRNRTIWQMGFDSAAGLVAYNVGLGGLFFLQ